MDTDAIIDAVGNLKTILAAANVGEVYDHIPGKPSYPCVIIAPSAPFIGEREDETYGEVLEANFDIWVAGTPGNDNKSIQWNIYRQLTKALTALDSDGIRFNEASQPLPLENNQANTLAAYITVSVDL